VKLLAYRIFDPTKASLLAKKQAKKPLDLTPQIATRAYEIYEDRGHHDGQADQDWMEAEAEIRRGQAGPVKAPDLVTPKA
jgi:H+-transporting ATPase